MRFLLLTLVFAGFAGCAARGPSATHVLAAADAAAPQPPTPTATAVRFERPAPPTHEGSRVALARAAGRDVALVSDESSDAVRLVDLAAKKTIASVAVRRPAELLILADGTAAVAARGEDAVVVLELRSDDTLTASARWATARGPVALASSPDDAAVYVASTGADVVQGFRADGTPTLRAPTRDAPRGLAVTGDGKTLLVAHAAASDVLAIDTTSGQATSKSLDTDLLEVAPLGDAVLQDDGDGKLVWMFGNGMGTNWARQARAAVAVRARHAYAFARAGSTLMIAHEEMLPDPTPRDPNGATMDAAGGYGGVAELGAEFQLVSMFDARTGKPAGDRATMGACRLPRGAAFEPKTETLFVACSGEDRLVPFRRFEGERSFGGVRSRPMGGPFMAAMARIPTCAGPESVAIDEERGRLVVACTLQPSIEIVPLARRDWEKTERIDLASPADGAAERGRALFFRAGDARIAADGRACASCHVDGAGDGLVWSTPQGMRNTKSLAGRGDAGPFGWKGESATLASHIARTVRVNLGGRGLPASDVDDLVAYVAHDAGSRGPTDALATRGADVFRERGCAVCHDGGGSDQKRHDVGSGGRFLTPTLAGVGFSAPYFHDGRYATLEELLEKTRGKMGTNDPLERADRDALVAYLKSL